MVNVKDLKRHNKFIYCTIILFVFQFVSCMCKLKLTADIELLWYILTSFLRFVVEVEELCR